MTTKSHKNAKRCKTGDFSKTVGEDVINPVLELPVARNSTIVFIEGVDHSFDIFIDHIPEFKAIVPVVVPWQFHHISSPQVVWIVQVFICESFVEPSAVIIS